MCQLSYHAALCAITNVYEVVSNFSGNAVSNDRHGLYRRETAW
jgi:hypothetical protein